MSGDLELDRSRYRLRRVVFVASYLSFSLVAGVVILVPVWPPFDPVLAAVSFCGLLGTVVPAIYSEKRISLRTEKPVDEVRTEFCGPDSPAFALVRHRADRVSTYERGARVDVDGTTGGRTVFYKADRREDDRIEAALGVDDTTKLYHVVDVVERDDETEVVVDVVWIERRRLFRLFDDWVNDPLQRQLFRSQGYEPVDVEERHSVFQAPKFSPEVFHPDSRIRE